jgi:hypothetical protein
VRQPRLAAAAAILALGACSAGDEGTPIHFARVTPGITAVTLTAFCGEQEGLEVRETPTAVHVRLDLDHPEFDADEDLPCESHVEIPLDEPLGDRLLIDDVTGEEIDVRAPIVRVRPVR